MLAKKQRVLQIQPRNFHYSPIRFYQQEVKRDLNLGVKRTSEIEATSKTLHPIKFPRKINQSLYEADIGHNYSKKLVKKGSVFNRKVLDFNQGELKHFPSKSQLLQIQNSKIILPKLTLRAKQPLVTMVPFKSKIKNSQYLKQGSLYRKHQQMMNYNSSFKLMAVSPSPQFSNQVVPGPEYKKIVNEIHKA